MANSQIPPRVHFTLFIASNQAFRALLSEDQIQELIAKFTSEIAFALMLAAEPNGDPEVPRSTIVIGGNIPPITIGPTSDAYERGGE